MTTQQQKRAKKAASRTAEAQRHYRRQNAVAVGPEADAQQAREKELHRKRQARACIARIFRLQLPQHSHPRNHRIDSP
jgi:hypothetical protein